MVTRRSFALAGAAVLASGAASAALASVNLSQSGFVAAEAVTIFVPAAAGRPEDTIARLLAEPLGKALGSEVVVRNIDDITGEAAISAFAAATANGNSLLMGKLGSHALLTHYYKDSAFELVADFTPVGLIGASPIIYLVPAHSPVKTLADLDSHLKEGDPKARIAHCGPGTESHLACLKMKYAIGVHYMSEIYHSRSIDALDALAAGKMDILGETLASSLPYIKSGKVRAIAMASPTGLLALSENYDGTQGGFADLRLSAWNALFAPKGLSPELQEKLANVLSEILDDQATYKGLYELGVHAARDGQRGPKPLSVLQALEIDGFKSGQLRRSLGLA